MAPRAINFKPGSIIFFKGDSDPHIYILRSGKISLNYDDIQTGQTIRELIQTGEFFGVKAALGNYHQDETAEVLQASTVIRFTVQEFEAFAAQNDRIILKMMKVFSNQLRRIHRQVQTLLMSDDPVNPEEGLFNVGQYYASQGKISEARTAFEHYLNYYPSGVFAAESASQLRVLPEKSYTPGSYTHSDRAEAIRKEQTEKLQHQSDSRKKPPGGGNFAEAERLYNNGDYEKALPIYQEIADDQQSRNKAMADYKLGCTLYYLEKYEEAATQLSQTAKANPKHPEMGSLLLFLAKTHQERGDLSKAGAFIGKAGLMLESGHPNFRLLRQAKEDLGV